MARDTFLQSVRTAVRFVAPRVDVDNPYDKPIELERVLRGATVWLSPKSVEGFDPKDLEGIPPTMRQALANNVQDFIAVAKQVASNEAATPEQVASALPLFLSIVTTVQKIVLDEWISAANHLVAQAQQWAQARDWPTKFFLKQISEDLLGTYELKKLVFAAEGSSLVLNPVGRFVPGAEGMFDLAVLPVYESVMVVRDKGRWHLHPLPGADRRRAWSEAAFVETVEKLARLA